MDVIVYAHIHWDREWYRPFQEFRLRLIDVLDGVIEQLLNNTLTDFYLDGQVIAIEDYLEVHPYRKQEIIELIKNKKLKIGPWYVLADEFLVSGESLIRNLLIGINESRDLGGSDFVGYLPDAFGHISDIPRILASFGIENTVVWRGVGNHKSEFVWKSKDGSSVFATHLIEGYYQDILNQPYSIEEKTKKIGQFLNKIREHNLTDYILLPAGADHLAVAPNFVGQIDEINKHIHNYTLRPDSLINYINLVKNKNPQLETVEGELRDNSRNPILSGTFSSRLYLKKANARSTWKLNKLAEPLQAHLEQAGLSPSRKNELEYVWKMLLKNHPHDSICGCSVDEVHDEMMSRFTQVDQVSDGLIGRCFHELAHRVKKGNIIIYNSSDHAFNGVIKVKTTEKLPENLMSQYLGETKGFPKEVLFDTQRIPVKEDIKDHNEHLIWVEDILPHSINIIDSSYKYKKHPTIVETGPRFIKNSRIMLRVNDIGVLTLSDSDSGKEFYNLHILQDYADKGDTYNFCPIPNDQPREGILVRTEVVENGNLRGVLRLFYEIEIPESLDKDERFRSMVALTHIMVVDVIVHADSRRVEFKAMWENFSRDHTLQVKFRFSDKVYKTIAENNFGLIERTFNPDYSLSASMPAEKGQELKTNTAPMQRFVWANGLGVITEGLPEYGVDGNDLYITLLRSVGKLSRESLGTRNLAAGPPLDTPGAQCLGVQRLRYAICATEKPEELFMEADQFMRSILTETGVAQDNSKEQEIPHNLLNLDNPNIYTYALKLPHDNKQKGLVVRLMNISDIEQNIKIKSDQGFFSIVEVNSLEEHIAQQASIDEEIQFKPYELKTLLLK
ncbi:MAG: hypothetical protein A2287_03940 [Candidatus Melainabacteria bacterium RIFOXYA12_FULL_32_12]|nr:MAG: hypothetical protein A2255_07900 [Candidatus Melainabacteria bacterium RIFOXYA2_FULL_32_9]OGI31628.1 MAG: hypothetical protein A2287_03940 [Candidatus Melainabacteria bacterium RIFOXYA12_FULL_32_12]